MQFAVRVLKFADALPNKPSGRAIANQIARSGTSVAASYRAALQGKSRADFANKITTVVEEADETGLRTKAEELMKIFNSTRTSTRNRKS